MRNVLITLVVVALLATAGQAATYTFQNGVGGYSSNTWDHMNRGGWGPAGYEEYGLGPWFPSTDEPFDMACSSYGGSLVPPYPYFARTLVKFGNIAVAAGETVVSARLVVPDVTHLDGSLANLYVYQALQPWTKGNVWWLNWGNGGDDAGYLGTLMHNGTFPGEAFSGQTLSWDLDAATVQGWLNNPSTNFGMVVTHAYGNYVSHWWSTAMPQLVLETIPEPTTICLLGLGMLGLLRKKQ